MPSVKKIVAVFLIFLSLLLTANYLLPIVRADEIEDLQKQIDELNKARELSVKATKPLEGQLESLKRQLDQIQASLDNLSLNIKQKQKISTSFLPLNFIWVRKKSLFSFSKFKNWDKLEKISEYR